MSEPYRVPPSKCTNCGHVPDAADTVSGNDKPPEVGDYTICLYCSHLMVYGDNMVLRNPNDLEMKEIAGDPGLLEAQAFVAEYRRQFGDK